MGHTCASVPASRSVSCSHLAASSPLPAGRSLAVYARDSALPMDRLAATPVLSVFPGGSSGAMLTAA